MPMQYIDPMEMLRSQPDYGGQFSQTMKDVGQAVGGLIAQLPEAKRIDIQRMDDKAFKQQVYDQAVNALKVLGVDPMTVNIPNPNDERFDKEKYAEQTANILAPYAEGPGATVKPEVFKALGQSQNPIVQENLQRQDLLTQLDPMGRIDTSKMQTIQPNQGTQGAFGPALSEGASSSFDPMTGIGVDAATSQTSVAPETKPAPLSENALINSAAPYLIEGLKSGTVPAGKVYEKLLDLELANTKMKADQQKADNDFWREMIKSNIDTNEIVDQKGNPTTVTKKNVDQVGLGKRIANAGGIGAYSMLKYNEWTRINGRPPQTQDEWAEVFATSSSDFGIRKSVEKAGSEAAARNLAPEKLSEKETSSLESMRKQFANLSNASTSFQDKFVTPYIGKGVKLAYLRANDPNFAQFTTPLALALNEYRRLNFGTAQTQSEIQNFLDVLNTDLNVSPEVFQQQLDGVVSSIERDYADMITTRKQQNKVVPPNLDDIKIEPQPVAQPAAQQPSSASKYLDEIRARRAARGQN